MRNACVYAQRIHVLTRRYLEGYDGITAAAERGYKFVFNDVDLVAELMIPENVLGTKWDIPVAKAVDRFKGRDIYNKSAVGSYENVGKFSGCETSFPS